MGPLSEVIGEVTARKIYMGEPSHFGRIWVTKTSMHPAFGLKNGQNISPDSGEIFVGDGLFQYKNLVISPVLAVFSIKNA